MSRWPVAPIMGMTMTTMTITALIVTMTTLIELSVRHTQYAEIWDWEVIAVQQMMTRDWIVALIRTSFQTVDC